MFAKKTTLIIPTRNRPYFLLKLLKNLKSQKYWVYIPKKMELL